MKEIRKSEVLRMFSNNDRNIRGYSFSETMEGLMWIEVDSITWRELEKLNEYIVDIQPWSDDTIQVAISPVINE